MVILSSYSQDENSSEPELRVPQTCLDPNLNQGDIASETSPSLEQGTARESLRPDNFDEYIGQEKLKSALKISMDAARKRQDIASMGHVMLYGPPGLGKTSCAYLIAKELGTSIKTFSAPALDRPKDIIGILMSLNTGDVLFIDEIHRLNKVTEELLYPALEDFEVDLNSGKDSSSRIMRLKINKFILVGATTKLGYISAPLRDRFLHVHRMQYYTHEELAEIISKNAKKLLVNINSSGLMEIASRSRGTPRIANRLLRLVRDYADHLEADLINEQVAHKALDLYQIDKYGLDKMDKKILEVLIQHYKGGPAGLETIASLIGEDKNTVEDYYEPFLIQSGLLLRTQRGRVVTEKGLEYCR